MAVANPAAAGANTQLDDVDTMISRLEQRLQANPNDGEGYRMLGWSYQNTGKPAEAIKAYAQAVRLLPGRADVLAGYGEALVAVAADKVTPEAKAQFEAALRADAQQPRARFFLSLYKAQNGQEAAALEEWIALSNSATADQPWQGDVQKRINALAAKLGKDIKGRLKAPAIAASETPIISSLPGIPAPGAGPDAAALAAADTLSEAERQTMINGMVNGLAEKLEKNPQDPDGWAKLLRSRMVLKQTSEAKADLANARKALAADPAKLQYVDAAAKELGL
jgi:cytochrome c-type biogenesis protein CcmH